MLNNCIIVNMFTVTGTVKARRESTTMSMETIQHTTYKQETMLSESSNTSR